MDINPGGSKKPSVGHLTAQGVFYIFKGSSIHSVSAAFLDLCLALEAQWSPERKVGISRLKGKKEAALGREHSVKILVAGTLGYIGVRMWQGLSTCLGLSPLFSSPSLSFCLPFSLSPFLPSSLPPHRSTWFWHQPLHLPKQKERTETPKGKGVWGR